MIILNGEPFFRYNLRSLSEFAHQIIIVKGASLSAKAITTAPGHSTDNTLQTLRSFIRDEDPDHKIQQVIRLIQTVRWSVGYGAHETKNIWVL